MEYLGTLTLTPYIDKKHWRLHLWDTHKRESSAFSRYYLAYNLIAPDGSVIFSGDSWSPSPLHSIDGPDSFYGCLSCLCSTAIEDTTTPAQETFICEHAESLNIAAYDWQNYDQLKAEHGTDFPTRSSFKKKITTWKKEPTFQETN